MIMLAPTIDARMAATLPPLMAEVDGRFHDPCWIIGSAAMQLAGVAGVVPNDLDLLCSERDAEALQRNWGRYQDSRYRPAEDDRFRSRFARFHHLPMPLEAMGGLQVKGPQGWQPVAVLADTSVTVAGVNARIPTLEEQLRILRLFGRGKDLAKAERILDHLAVESRHAH